MDRFAVRSRLTAEQRKAVEVEVVKFRDSIIDNGPAKVALVRAFRENMQRAFLRAISKPHLATDEAS